jgi:hypothetical protein
MSVTKRINGDYTIITSDPDLGTSGNVTVIANNMFVDGNLLVGGTSTQVVKTNLNITDNIIYLNYGETGAGVSLNTSGIEVARGTLANVGILWNESLTKWVGTSNGTTYLPIVMNATGTAIANVYADSAPAISANLDLRGHKVWDSTNLSANVSLGSVGAGATGLYTTTNLGTHEVVSKRMALIYNTLL